MDNIELLNIAIVIPNFNGLNDLKCVYKSISNQSYKNYKVIMVDNGSADYSVPFTKETYPEHVVISLDKNYGFSVAVNKGITYALESLNADVILLLNNDIELKGNFFEEASRTFSEVPDAGFIAVKMLNFFDRNKIDDAGDSLKSFGGYPIARGHGEIDKGQYDKPEFIFGACAGAALYKSELFLNAGMFDENFFAYYEDIDLSMRFQLYGYKCFYNPKLVCYHKRGETVQKFRGWETYYTERNIVSLRLKNYPLSLYIKHSLFFFLARVRRYYKFLFLYPKGTFMFALKGYFSGVILIHKSIKKRRLIQSNRKVSNEYLEKTFLK
jgi:hypothetical protein